MKRFQLFVLAAVVAAVPALAQSGGLRYTVTVSQFENRAGYQSSHLGDAWGAVMTDLLHQTGRFVVLGETDMRGEALGEQDFGASGRVVQGAKTPAIGQMTPAQLLVKGAITHVEHSTGGGRGGLRLQGIRLGGRKQRAQINATVYVADSTTGQVVASSQVTGSSQQKGLSLGYSAYRWGGDLEGFENDNVGQALEAAVAEAVDWIVDQLPGIPWRGSVALVRQGRVYINRGAREGVAPGQAFDVGEAEVIRDPETGEVLDELLSEVARIQVAVVKDKLAICRVVSGQADWIQRGMAVHLPGTIAP